jgi:hypothetical protein
LVNNRGMVRGGKKNDSRNGTEREKMAFKLTHLCL